MYNVQAKTLALISLAIIIVMTFLGPVVARIVETAEMKTIKVSADAFEAAFEQVKNGEIPCADLATLTDAEWDTLYVFGPYTTKEKIDETLGKAWKYTQYTSIDIDDSITLLLFTKDQDVVAFTELSRGIADFAYLSGEVYGSDNACFSVDETGRIVEVESEE